MVAAAGAKEAEMREMRELQGRVHSKVTVASGVEELIEGLAGILESAGVSDPRVNTAVNDLRGRKKEWAHAVLDNTPAP